MAIKIEMLRCFCAVAQSGNLSEAADRLGRTQSAVSMMLKQFENHLGKKLFLGERKNHLTALGEQVLEMAQKTNPPVRPDGPEHQSRRRCHPWPDKNSFRSFGCCVDLPGGAGSTHPPVSRGQGRTSGHGHAAGAGRACRW